MQEGPTISLVPSREERAKDASSQYTVLRSGMRHVRLVYVWTLPLPLPRTLEALPLLVKAAEAVDAPDVDAGTQTRAKWALQIVLVFRWHSTTSSTESNPSGRALRSECMYRSASIAIPGAG